MKSLISVPCTFVVLNCAAVAALYHFMRGSRDVWSRYRVVRIDIDQMLKLPPVIHVIADKKGFIALKDEWNFLLPQSTADCLFMTWEWLYTWWSHFGSGRKLHLIEVRRDGVLMGLAPFSMTAKRVEFLGTGSVGSDYLDLIVRPGFEEYVIDSIATHLQQIGVVVRFDRIRSVSLVRKLAERLSSGGGHVLPGSISICPFIPLAGHTWDTFVASLGTSHRTNVRRRLKKSAEAGATFEVTQTEEARQENFRALIDLHRKCWEDRGGSDGLHNDALIAFHDEFTRVALERKWLRLFMLKLDGKPVASVYGLQRNGTFYFYQSGYDPEFSNLSVGLVALGLSIQRAIEEDAEVFDFLHGDEEYKFRWASQSQSIRSMEVYPRSLEGALSMHFHRVARSIRRMARRMILEKGAAVMRRVVVR